MRNNISATITGFDGSKFQLIARNIGPDENPFLVYIEGDRVDSRLIHRAGDEYVLEMSSAVSVAETTDINIRFYNFDHYIEVSDDLRGFVNNPNESRFPRGLIIQQALFYRFMLGNRSLFAASQRMIDHVSGAGSSREDYIAIGYGVALDLLRYGIIRADTDKVFDIGCGCGRVGQFIATVLDEAKGGQYTGFDTWKEGVDWATETLTPLYPHARFRHIGPTIESPYDAASAYQIALEDASHDAFIANSLFTHLRREPADYYLSEVARVLKPNGRAYISYFASKEHFREVHPNANCDEDAYGIYFVKPECEDAFVEAHEVEKMAATHGLRLLGKRWGRWRGPQFAYRGLGGYQDRFMFKKV